MVKKQFYMRTNILNIEKPRNRTEFDKISTKHNDKFYLHYFVSSEKTIYNI